MLFVCVQHELIDVAGLLRGRRVGFGSSPLCQCRGARGQSACAVLP